MPQLWSQLPTSSNSWLTVYVHHPKTDYFLKSKPYYLQKSKLYYIDVLPWMAELHFIQHNTEQENLRQKLIVKVEHISYQLTFTVQNMLYKYQEQTSYQSR